MEIPDKMLDVLLPSKSASVQQLLDFKLPEVLNFKGTYKIDDIVTRMDATDFDPKILSRIPIPPFENFQEIAKAAVLRAADGGGSIACTHYPWSGRARFPLWIAAYWVEVVDITERFVKPWRQALAKLRGRMRGWDSEVGFAHQKRITAELALKQLKRLRWADEIRTLEKDFDVVTSLTHYLTDKWLTNGNINQMLAALRRKLANEGFEHNVAITGTTFTHLLTQTYNDNLQKDVDYHANKHLEWLRTVAADAVSHSGKIGLIFHIRSTHWVPVIVDTTHGVLFYGDSLAYEPDEVVLLSVRWWISQHTTAPLKLENLTCTQQRDTISCGLMAYNAIAHHFLPESVPLAAASDVAVERLRALIDIVDYHCNQVHFLSFGLVFMALKLTL